MNLFGQAPPASQAGFGSAPSLFGAPAQGSAPLFGSAGQSAPSLFGAPAQSAAAGFGAPAQSSGALFGAPAQGSQPSFGAPAQSASLFGAPQQSSASLFGAPAQSASLFGAPQQRPASQFGAPTAQSGSLFGAPAQSSASLFGAPAQSTSLFGAPAQSTSLFGAPAQNASLFGAPAQGTSLFGAPAQSAPSLFGSAPQQQQQPTAQAHRPEITGRTRISQLPQNLQTDLFAVERHLREQRTKGSQLWSKRSNVESEIARVQSRSAAITRRLVKLQAGLESLKANSDTLKTAVRTERGSAEPVLVALENLSKSRYSSQGGFLGDGGSFRFSGSQGRIQDGTTHVPEEYFARTLDELESRAHEYKREIDEIADFLRAQGIVLSRTAGTPGKLPSSQNDKRIGKGSLMDSISQRHVDIGIGMTDDSIESRGKAIEDIIRRQYEYFMVVASHIAGVHDNLRSIREQFLQLLRSRDPDMLDPFQQADLREKAEKERRRIVAETQASGSAMGYGSNFFGVAASQPSLMGNQGSSLGTGGGFPASGTSGAAQTGLFGNPSGIGFGTNPGSSAGGGAQSRKLSGARRKRS